MTAYRRGVYREMQTAARLIEDGYMVLTSRGSHGVADLVAIKVGQVLAIQCKSGDAGLRGSWLNELYDAATEHGAIPIVADWPKRGTLRLRRVTGRHAPRSQSWPVEHFATDEVAERANPEGGASCREG